MKRQKKWIILVLLVSFVFFNASADSFSSVSLFSTRWLSWESSTTQSSTRVFHLNPISGSLNNSGSKESPWPSLQEVIEADMIQRWEPTSHSYYDGSTLFCVNPDSPVKPGDTLILHDGNHGTVSFRYAHNPDYISIEAAPGEYPEIHGLNLEGVERLILRGLTFTGELGIHPHKPLVRIAQHNRLGPCRYIYIEQCYIYSTTNTEGWSASDWNSRASHGISISGDHVSLHDTLVKNVNYGITMNGDFMHAKGNTVENFCGDAIRGNGNDQIFDSNLVINCFDVNNDHRDGFQSFSVRGQPPRERVIIRNNTIIGYTDPDRPYAGTLQGIGCFDGFYKMWIVENNLIVTDHYHGISFYGAGDVIIRNNTVVDLDHSNDVTPSIRIVPHKDGRPSYRCYIWNNIATRVSSEGLTSGNNLELESLDYENIFIDPSYGDFRPVVGGPAHDTGSEKNASSTDIIGTARPQGLGVDIGAYEYKY